MLRSITSPTSRIETATSIRLSLHHLGFVVQSIAKSVGNFVSGLQLSWDGQIVYDPIQTVRVTFLQHQSAGLPSIELVEPAAPGSYVTTFLRRGGGLHHVCYETDDIGIEVETTVQSGGILLLPPAPAIAFNGRKIAWVCTPDRLLLEYLERIVPPEHAR